MLGSTAAHTRAPYDLDGFFDEAYDDRARPRPHYRGVLEDLATRDLDALSRSVCDGAVARGQGGGAKDTWVLT